MGKLIVLSGINTITPGCHHRNGGPAGIKRTAMSRSVNPSSQTTNHTKSRLCQLARQLSRNLYPCQGRATRPNNRNPRQRKRFNVSHAKKGWRCIRQLCQQARIIRLTKAG
jgi:hypothetical protein